MMCCQEETTVTSEHFLLHLLHSKRVGVYMEWEGGQGGALAYTVITVYTNCMINWRLVVGIMRDL